MHDALQTPTLIAKDLECSSTNSQKIGNSEQFEDTGSQMAERYTPWLPFIVITQFSLDTATVGWQFSGLKQSPGTEPQVLTVSIIISGRCSNNIVLTHG